MEALSHLGHDEDGKEDGHHLLHRHVSKDETGQLNEEVYHKALLSSNHVKVVGHDHEKMMA